jgi:hypothetical protein
MIAIFPIACFYEAAVYSSSHNLIPFELFFYFLFSLPITAGAYLGKLIAYRVKTKRGTAK